MADPIYLTVRTVPSSAFFDENCTNRMVPGVLFILAMAFQPESPRWLVEYGQYESAARVLAFVSRTSVDDKGVLLMLDDIKRDFSGKKTISFWKQFPKMGESRVIALRCFIPSLVMFFQQVGSI
jgi:hypothetical protein